MTLVRSLDSVAAATDLETPRVYFVSMAFPIPVSETGARTIWITPREAVSRLYT